MDGILFGDQFPGPIKKIGKISLNIYQIAHPCQLTLKSSYLRYRSFLYKRETVGGDGT